jgi:hypothetical protein
MRGKSRTYLIRHLLRINPPIEKIKKMDGEPLDYFFRPINLGHGAVPKPLKAIKRDGQIVLVEIDERRGRKRKDATVAPAYAISQKRRLEAYRRIHKAPKNRLKASEKNRRLIFDIAEKLDFRKLKRRHLITKLVSICLRRDGYPRDRKTITKYIDEFLFISLR